MNGLLVVLVLVWLAALVLLWLAINRSNATRAVFTEGGVPVQDVVFHEGDEPRSFNLDLLKPDETIDETYENERFGYDNADSGILTAPDGSSTVVVNGLVVTVTPLTPSALDGDGNPIPSQFFGKADSATEVEEGVPVVQLIEALMRVTVLARNVNADHAEFRMVPNPTA